MQTEMMQNTLFLRGARVLLRPLREDDLAESVRVWTPELRYCYGGSRLAPAADPEAHLAGKRRWFDRVRRGEEGHVFAIETDDRYIGFAILGKLDGDGNASYRVGLENPEYWGRGYGMEVTRLMLRYAFEDLDLHRVHLRVTAYNLRARGCYEKAGFRVEGVLRQSFQVDGEWQDDLLMAILREEWEAQQEAVCTDAGEVRVRRYRTADYPAVLAVWETAAWQERANSREEAITYKLIHDPAPCFVAEIDGVVVGTALTSWDGRWAWITAVAVLPDYRRRGVARRLMEACEEALAKLGAHQACLLAHKENAAAMNLYQSLGYEGFEFVAYLRKKLLPAAPPVAEKEGCCGG
jgi:[ribosomal protein S5]-alanine N-acetyltransferase